MFYRGRRMNSDRGPCLYCGRERFHRLGCLVPFGAFAVLTVAYLILWIPTYQTRYIDGEDDAFFPLFVLFGLILLPGTIVTGCAWLVRRRQL